MKRWLPAALLAILACGDSTAPVAERSTFDFSDPAADTISFAGSDTIHPALDVVEVSGTAARDTLVLTVRFAGAIQSGSAAPNAAVGLIELDVDADSATGIPAVTDEFANTAGIGVEFYVFVPGAGDAGVEVQDIATMQSAQFPASYTADAVTMRIPFSAIGDPTGAMRLIGLMGTSQRATDLFPNGGSYLIDATATSRVTR
ncbi:MAG TPA: hypothetical protein VF041_02705 [Gemmatimonadaceae bacterium]